MYAHVQFEYQYLVSTWERATRIKGVDAHVARADRSGRAMRWADFENRQSQYGWTVIYVGPTGCSVLRDHIVAVNIHHNDNEVQK